MKRAGPADFSATMRIYWEDTDAAGIVFYANYLKFFERARTEWLRSLGFGQEQLRTEAGIAFVVSETGLRYRRPARLDDQIDVSVAVVHLGQASLELAQEARRADELLADGTIRIGCVELGTFRPCRIPNDIRLALGPANAPYR
jgi:acyl-CoA thioester hydrolase